MPPTRLRRLLATRFVGLFLAYQVLSALASQLSDYLVFDRAAAQFPDADDLARFLGYTAVMNVVSIAFLVLVAGPLLRRYGLRLGISANPVVLLAASVVMLVVLVCPAVPRWRSSWRCRPPGSSTSRSPTARPARRSTRCTRCCPSACGSPRRPRSRGRACRSRSARPACSCSASTRCRRRSPPSS